MREARQALARASRNSPRVFQAEEVPASRVIALPRDIMGVKTSITGVYQVVLYEDIYGRIDPRFNRECPRCPLMVLRECVSSVYLETSTGKKMRISYQLGSCPSEINFTVGSPHSVRILINTFLWAIVTPTSPR